MSHEHVLEYVNQVRQDLGLKPRKKLAKGRRKASTSCPIANSFPSRLDAIASTVGPLTLSGSGPVGSLRLPNGRYNIPSNVTLWMVEFDQGKHPEFEA